MNRNLFYVLPIILLVLLPSITSSPIKFENDERSPQERGRSLHESQEGRVFHPHAIKKRKKKKLLQCLLNLQRSNPHGDPRTLFFNYFNLEVNQHEGHQGHDGGSNCLNQLSGGNGGDYGGGSPLGGLGEGIDNLSSLVSQVGQAPGDLISSVGDGIKPVFENPERYLNRYLIRPLYRSLRPLYRLF